MVAYVNTELMAICDPDDHDHVLLIADYLSQMIESQAGMGTSGAQSWIEKLLEE